MSTVDYQGAHGIILYFSCMDRQSFTSLEGWYNEAIKHRSLNTKVYLVCTKVTDVSQREVSSKEGRRWAKNKGIEYLKFQHERNLILSTYCFQSLMILSMGADFVGYIYYPPKTR